jgi:hypothetical protein
MEGRQKETKSDREIMKQDRQRDKTKQEKREDKDRDRGEQGWASYCLYFSGELWLNQNLSSYYSLFKCLFLLLSFC